jgi:hypothetical protein
MTLGSTGLGSALTQQVADETDEERRKRIAQQQQQKLVPGTAMGNSLLQMSITGGYGGIGGI